MSELVSLREPDVTVVADGTYNFAGVYCFGRGVFAGERKTGLDFAYKCLSRLREGDFVYPKLMAWEGALGIVPPECSGLCVSPEYPVFSVNTERVLPEVLDVYFRSPSAWPQLAEISTGTNMRRRRLHPSSFLAFKMPLPPMETQRRLREVKKRLDSLADMQTQTTAELDALLPSILDKAFNGSWSNG
jgi:type I restriction enzyme S subunit